MGSVYSGLIRAHMTDDQRAKEDELNEQIAQLCKQRDAISDDAVRRINEKTIGKTLVCHSDDRLDMYGLIRHGPGGDLLATRVQIIQEGCVCVHHDQMIDGIALAQIEGWREANSAEITVFDSAVRNVVGLTKIALALKPKEGRKRAKGK